MVMHAVMTEGMRALTAEADGLLVASHALLNQWRLLLLDPHGELMTMGLLTQAERAELRAGHAKSCALTQRLNGRLTTTKHLVLMAILWALSCHD